MRLLQMVLLILPAVSASISVESLAAQAITPGLNDSTIVNTTGRSEADFGAEPTGVGDPKRVGYYEYRFMYHSFSGPPMPCANVFAGIWNARKSLVWRTLGSHDRVTPHSIWPIPTDTDAFIYFKGDKFSLQLPTKWLNTADRIAYIDFDTILDGVWDQILHLQKSSRWGQDIPSFDLVVTRSTWTSISTLKATWVKVRKTPELLQGAENVTIVGDGSIGDISYTSGIEDIVMTV